MADRCHPSFLPEPGIDMGQHAGTIPDGKALQNLIGSNKLPMGFINHPIGFNGQIIERGSRSLLNGIGFYGDFY